MIDLTLHHLKEGESKAEVTLHTRRHIAKDKEATVRVVNVLETVERRHHSASECTVSRGYNVAFRFISTHKITAHEEIRALEVVAVSV